MSLRVMRHMSRQRPRLLNTLSPPSLSCQPGRLRQYSEAVGGSARQATRPSSIFRKVIGYGAFGFVFMALGYAAAASPAAALVSQLRHQPSDAETLRMYEPQDDTAKAVEAFINQHPLAVELRKNPDMVESRPHMKIPPALRQYSLTGGTLMGTGKITVPPFCWVEKGGKSLVSIAHIGPDLCGYPKIIHGGLVATMLDEGMARCCFPALPHNVGVTARLDINYRKPAPADSYLVLRATTTKVEGRKAWVDARLETLPRDGEEPLVLAEATALFISPKFAAKLAFLNPTG